MRFCTVTIALLLSTTASVLGQAGAAARFRGGDLPVIPPEAFGGGEVVLEVTVDSSGSVSSVAPNRTTPPFTESMIAAVRAWRFSPATSVVDGRLTPVATPVLVIGLFRPPAIYGSPAPGALPKVVGPLSPRVPQPGALAMPPYPPNATGNAIVIVEIELTRLGAARGYKVVSSAGVFDSAALDAVRTWRFTSPRDVGADNLFVYAVVGFRTPVTR